MSGAELALAIVPLVIVLIEHHRTAFHKSKALTSSSFSNDSHLDFYEELQGELSLLNATLEIVRLRSNRLKYCPVQEKRSRVESIDIALGSSTDDFKRILDRVLKSINDLVRERSNELTSNDTDDQRAMLQRLHRLEEKIKNREASKSILEKFRFTHNERTRNVAMVRIHEGTLKLERLLRSSIEIYDHQIHIAQPKPPANRMRRLPEELFKKLATKWHCSCDAQHLARLCLWNCCGTNTDNDHPDDSLDIIVSVRVVDRGLSQWQECSIRVMEKQRDQVDVTGHSRNQVQLDSIQVPPDASSALPCRDIDSHSLCHLLQIARIPNSRLQLLFKDGTLWQQRSKLPRLHIQHQLGASLRSLLEDAQCWEHCDLRDRSILAVTLAHAVMHFHEVSSLRAKMNKEHIFFFRKNGAQHPDVSRPFLAMEFTQQQIGMNEADDLSAIHSRPTLLSLGVLLLEITNGTPIEKHWDPEDLTDGLVQNDSTNLTAALRLLRNSDGKAVLGLQRAVRACLEWDKLNVGRENEGFAERIYELIVQPLEDILRHGFEMTPEQLSFD